MSDAAYNAGHGDAMSAAFEEVMRLEKENAALRAKAALFDVLAAAVAREDSTDWEVYHGIENLVVIYMRATGEMVGAKTLAGAVEKAMEAEGGGK